MNLKDFSLLKEDDDHYTIGHPKGRSLNLPKKGLSDKAHQLIQNLKKEQGLDEGTADAPVGQDSNQPSEDSSPARQDDFDYMMDKVLPTPRTPEKVAQEQALLPQTPEPGQYSEPTVPGQEESAPKLTSDAEQAAAQQAKSDEAPPSPPQDQSMFPVNTELGKTQKELRGLQNELKQAQKLNTREIPEPEETAEDIFKRRQAQDDAFAKAIPSIDANRYWKNKDTGSKISSAIAMMVSGIGAGLTGGQNSAVQAMNTAIDRDIDAQKNDQSRAMNAWKMHREATGSEIQANLLTRNNALAIARARMEQAMNTTNNVNARAQLSQNIMGINQQMATQNWMLSRAQGGAPGTEAQHVGELQVMQRLNPELYKDMQSKYIPGVGIAKVPIRDTDKEAFKAYDEMTKAVNDAKAFQSQLGMAGAVPFTQQGDIAQQKKMSIALAMNKLNGLSRLNDTELHAFQQGISKLGSFQSGRANAQLDELLNQIAIKKTAEMKSLGAVPFKQASNPQTAMAWLAQNPNHPDALAVRQSLGIR